MPYYVPLGGRGLILNLGTRLVGALGAARYWNSHHSRARKLNRVARNGTIPAPHFRQDSALPARQADSD